MKASTEYRNEYLELKQKNDEAEARLFKVDILRAICNDLNARLDDMPLILAERLEDATPEDFARITDCFKDLFSTVLDEFNRRVH
jgi:hypothetical protein